MELKRRDFICSTSLAVGATGLGFRGGSVSAAKDNRAEVASAPERKPLASELFTLFQADGRRWFKGNTHTHTTCSDGRRTPEQVAEWYRGAGYDFIFLTDHEEKLASPSALPDFEKLSTDDMLVLPGIECMDAQGRRAWTNAVMLR